MICRHQTPFCAYFLLALVISVATESTSARKCFDIASFARICVADDFTITITIPDELQNEERASNLLVADNIYICCDGICYRKSEGSLTPTGSMTFMNGTDPILGFFYALIVEWIAPAHLKHSPNNRSNVMLSTSLRIYPNAPHAIVKFTQEFPTECTNAVDSHVGTSADTPISGFPVFNATASGASLLNYVTFGSSSEYGAMGGKGWSTSMTSIYHGVPMIIYDSTGNTIVLSPVDHFLVNMLGFADETQELSVGMQPRITNIPASHNMSFVMVLGKGIQPTIDVLASFLHSTYGRTPACMSTTRDLRVLGYYSDNGACYYYNTEPNMTYEETYAAIFEEASQKKIPYGFYHLDSFFYTKDSGGGVGVCDVNKLHAKGSAGAIEWDGCSHLFPQGLRHLSENVLKGSNLSAHARLFSDHTIYAQGNHPGNHTYDRQFSFIKNPSKEAAIPATNASEEFWNFLMTDAVTRWNLAMYEQDWTATIYGDNTILQSDLRAGSMWLTTMAAAAEKHNVGVGYGSAWSGDTMHQVTTPAARWVYASPNPWNAETTAANWRISRPAIALDVVGSVPMKDTFWSSNLPQPHQPYTGVAYAGMDNVLHAIVATLSLGPVVPGDQLGFANRTTLLGTCRNDGVLLQPDRPCLALDQTFTSSALTTGRIFANLRRRSTNAGLRFDPWITLSGWDFCGDIDAPGQPSGHCPASRNTSTVLLIQNISAAATVPGCVKTRLRPPTVPHTSGLEQPVHAGFVPTAKLACKNPTSNMWWVAKQAFPGASHVNKAAQSCAKRLAPCLLTVTMPMPPKNTNGDTCLPVIWMCPCRCIHTKCKCTALVFARLSKPYAQWPRPSPIRSSLRGNRSERMRGPARPAHASLTPRRHW
eukprot:m.1187523 g.1187523  ORF g.1187523 m.1187523 type:complete len:876 (-) comp24549_c0_seq8:3093-5720(-)